MLASLYKAFLGHWIDLFGNADGVNGFEIVTILESFVGRPRCRLVEDVATSQLRNILNGN